MQRCRRVMAGRDQGAAQIEQRRVNGDADAERGLAVSLPLSSARMTFPPSRFFFYAVPTLRRRCLRTMFFRVYGWHVFALSPLVGSGLDSSPGAPCKARSFCSFQLKAF